MSVEQHAEILEDEDITRFIIDELRNMVRRGFVELTRNGKLHAHVQSLTDTVRKVRAEPEVEVRLTFDTLNIAACMFNAAWQQLERDRVVDEKLSDFPKIELTNGSAIVVLSDEEIVSNPSETETLIHEVMSNKAKPI